MIFKEALITSLSFAVRDSRFSHMCRAPLRFPHLSFMPPLPYPPPALEGKADDMRIAPAFPPLFIVNRDYFLD